MAGTTVVQKQNGAGAKVSTATALGERIAAFRFADLPEAAVRAAKGAILDTLGVALAGSREPAPHIVADVLGVTGREGEATIIGTDQRARAMDAALVNGTAAHALDFDDSTNAMGGHPSAPMLPALLALGERLGSSGPQIITAYVAGFETEAKIARSVNFHHFEKGWHPTATLGIFGAAAGCAHLLGLSPERIATALAIAVSFASGVKANFGTMTKPLHVGDTAHDGLMAALLAEREFTANPAAFDHHHGFFLVFNGEGTFETERIFATWADPLEILDPGIGVKQYPCCAGTHAPLDALFEIIRRDAPEAQAVARIQSWSHKRRIPHVDNPDPDSGLAAKFSLHYCLARALVDRSIGLEHFEGDAHSDPLVRSLMSKVEIAAYGDDMFEPSNHMGSEIHLTMNDGRILKGRVESSVGRSVRFPVTPGLLERKFDNCARRALSQGQADKLREAIATFDQKGTARSLMALAGTAS